MQKNGIILVRDAQGFFPTGSTFPSTFFCNGKPHKSETHQLKIVTFGQKVNRPNGIFGPWANFEGRGKMACWGFDTVIRSRLPYDVHK